KSGTEASSMSSTALAGHAGPLELSTARAWRGRAVEFLMVGGATPLLFALSWIARAKLGLDAAELAVGFTMFHAAHVINDPHFSITYLLFYRSAKERAFGASFPPGQRARYLLAGFVAPLALVVWAIAGLATRSAVTIGL